MKKYLKLRNLPSLNEKIHYLDEKNDLFDQNCVQIQKK
jgi:hypothetical protein